MRIQSTVEIFDNAKFVISSKKRKISSTLKTWDMSDRSERVSGCRYLLSVIPVISKMM